MFGPRFCNENLNASFRVGGVTSRFQRIAHAALGNIIIYYDYDFVGEEREEKRAIELNPNYATAHHWYSELLMGLGRHEEALAEIRRALEIDPLSLLRIWRHAEDSKCLKKKATSTKALPLLYCRYLILTVLLLLGL